MKRHVFVVIAAVRSAGAPELTVEQKAVQALRIADRAIVIELGCVRVTGSGGSILKVPEVLRAYRGLV
jgi:branched-chain amino acid transport system ATP-binding protein